MLVKEGAVRAVAFSVDWSGLPSGLAGVTHGSSLPGVVFAGYARNIAFLANVLCVEVIAVFAGGACAGAGGLALNALHARVGTGLANVALGVFKLAVSTVTYAVHWSGNKG